jgi:hypothetical protein
MHCENATKAWVTLGDGPAEPDVLYVLADPQAARTSAQHTVPAAT